MVFNRNDSDKSILKIIDADWAVESLSLKRGVIYTLSAMVSHGHAGRNNEVLQERDSQVGFMYIDT